MWPFSDDITDVLVCHSDDEIVLLHEFQAERSAAVVREVEAPFPHHLDRIGVGWLPSDDQPCRANLSRYTSLSERRLENSLGHRRQCCIRTADDKDGQIFYVKSVLVHVRHTFVLVDKHLYLTVNAVVQRRAVDQILNYTLRGFLFLYRALDSPRVANFVTLREISHSILCPQRWAASVPRPPDNWCPNHNTHSNRSIPV